MLFYKSKFDYERFCKDSCSNQQKRSQQAKAYNYTPPPEAEGYRLEGYTKNQIQCAKSLTSNETLNDECFWNQTFDKGRLKNFVLWFLKTHGEHKTIHLVEELKNIGFQYATKAGISLGIEDLKIPEKKYSLIMDAEQLSIATIKQYKRGEITGVERFQRLIDTWHRTSEGLKQEVIDNFEATDILNPVYMMAFSGARGNISQVRQLVGMRGLMSDPQGQIIDFPIRSNFREGLTLTEYIISSYGARKGIVDTALRTANAGYLTRRLVDVAQHVIISSFDCGTKRGIFLTDMKEGNKIIYSLQNRLVGRVLARDVYNKQKSQIAPRNVEISMDLAGNLAFNHPKIFVRSSLTCQTKKLVCQLCYGWSLAQGNLVPIGEAVGVVAAQSIGEPGTQLTMRTFHTGGVFSGDVSDQIRAPFNGIVEYDTAIAGTLIRTPEGKIAFLTKNEGSFIVHRLQNEQMNQPTETKRFKIPFYTLLFLKNGSITYEKEVIAQISSINRQKNATDQAELTIKSELSGQFYSKILDLKENKVGPKLKNTGGDNISEQFNENAVDTIFEAWGWGYAWVLAGKIYQIGLPSSIFPILGDFVNKKTYMNKIQWNLPSSFGSSFKLNITKTNKLFNHNSIKLMRQFSQPNSLNTTVLNNSRSELILLKNQLISFALSKICFKDIGYFLKLGLPMTSFSFKYQNIKNNFNPFNQSNFQSSILSTNDTLFLFSSLLSNKLDDDSNNSANKKQQNSIYPAHWQPNFDVFLNWFPKRLSTKTGGLILVEPTFFYSELPFQNVNDKPNSLKNTNLIKKISKKQIITLRSNAFLAGIRKSFKPIGFLKDYAFKTWSTSKSLKSPVQTIDFDNKKLHLSEQIQFESQSFLNQISKTVSIHEKKEFKTSQFCLGKNPFFPSFVRKDILFDGQRFGPLNTSISTDLISSNKSNSYVSGSLFGSEGKLNELADIKAKLVRSARSEAHLKIANFKDFKNISELSQSLISEQYSQNQFGTFIFNRLFTPSKGGDISNKNKSDLRRIGLIWTNAFKLNQYKNNSLSSLKTKSNLKINANLADSPAQRSTNGSKTMRKNAHLYERLTVPGSALNSNRKASFDRIFWVAQPFYNFSLKKSKMILFQNKNQTQVKLNGSNTFYSSNLEQNNAILFQITRQGQFKPFSSAESSIQISTPASVHTQKRDIGLNALRFLQNDEKTLLSNSSIKTLSLMLENLIPIDRKPKSISFNRNYGLKKLGKYSFTSFNANLNSDLKNRIENLLNFLKNEFEFNSKKKSIIYKKSNVSELVTLKTFSKMHSIPYFLNKKGSTFVKKYLSNQNDLKNKKTKKLNPTMIAKSKLILKSDASLFNIYFYSLLNKDSNYNLSFKTTFNQIKSMIKPHFLNKVKNISSLYLKDQLLFSDFNPVRLDWQSVASGLNLDIKNQNSVLLSNASVEKQNYQLEIFYYKESEYYSFKLNPCNKRTRFLKEAHDSRKVNLLVSEKTLNQIQLERIQKINHWIISSNILKKNYFKKLLTLNKNLYKKLFKMDSYYNTKKSFFINQNRKIDYFCHKKFNKLNNAPKKSQKNSNINITSKLGWVYMPTMLSNFFLYHKKLFPSGKKLDNLIFNPYPVYTEIIYFDKIESYMNLLNSFLIHNYVSLRTSIDPNQNGKSHNINFKTTIKNKKSRFQPKIIKNQNNVNLFFILIRKAVEYKLLANLDQKKEFYSHSDQQTIGPGLYTLNEQIPLRNFKSQVQNKNDLYSIIDSLKNQYRKQNNLKPKFLNQSFNSLNVYSQYKTTLLNKQQMTSQTIAKYPAADIKLISSRSFYSNLSALLGSKKNDQEMESTNFKINGPANSFEFCELNSLKPFNFAPIIVSYTVPYSVNYPFKHPLHLFTKQPDPLFSFANKISKTGVSTASQVNLYPFLKSVLYHYLLKMDNVSSNQIPQKNKESVQKRLNQIQSFNFSHSIVNLSSIFSCPIAEYSLGKVFEKLISVPNFLMGAKKTNLQDMIWNLNHVKNKKLLKGIPEKGMILGSLNGSFEFVNQSLKNKEIYLYQTEFASFRDHFITPQISFLKTSMYCSFEGELIYKTLKSQKSKLTVNNDSNSSSLFDQKNIDYGCMVLTKTDQIAFYFANKNYKEVYHSLENLKKKNQYMIDDIVINFLNISDENNNNDYERLPPSSKTVLNNNNLNSSLFDSSNSINDQTQTNPDQFTIQINQLPAGRAQQKNKLFLGEFLVYGDQISPNLAISKSGQIIHLNSQKITLRQGQPIFVSPKSILHKYDGDFIDAQSSVITLSYQQLKTGDIIQGIPKVEQFFEARTTKRGRLFRDSLSNLLKGLFKRYRSKLPFDQAVRQSFYKIQQIIVDGVQRVYRSQGVSIADKHLEVIVKQMTSKVRIIEGGQTGFFPGEIVDLDFVEHVNRLLMKKIIYEPLVLGITKASLEVDSFLSAASFQQTTRVLSKAAISRKKDFLKGLKENVILGNLIPAGTGYLVYLDTF